MSAMTMTAVEAYQLVRDRVESIVNSDPHSMATMENKDEWRQGDLRVIRLPDNFLEANADKLEKIEKPSQQIVPGNTTGSRHCWDSLRGITLYRLKNGNALDGQIACLAESRTITHPEHGDCCQLPGDGACYGFPQQRAYAEELRAVRD